MTESKEHIGRLFRKNCSQMQKLTFREETFVNTNDWPTDHGNNRDYHKYYHSPHTLPLFHISTLPNLYKKRVCYTNPIIANCWPIRAVGYFEIRPHRRYWKPLIRRQLLYETSQQKLRKLQTQRAVGSLPSNPFGCGLHYLIAWTLPCNQIAPSQGGTRQFEWNLFTIEYFAIRVPLRMLIEDCLRSWLIPTIHAGCKWWRIAALNKHVRHR